MMIVGSQQDIARANTLKLDAKYCVELGEGIWIDFIFHLSTISHSGGQEILLVLPFGVIRWITLESL